ncbi:MAG: AbrB/MazE/SpoVT family DNA-binding domain-containing protein [Candidatus Bathyarchaeota archaeon]|nr:AbrB/MazE/SpoVT family DNA-binding domain-containing protein [Candidatus Bathyarchaeota archaeon]
MKKAFNKESLLTYCAGIIMENEVVVTKRGQTTIPARLRKKFKIAEGTKLEVVETSEGILFKLKESTNDFTGAYPQFATPQEMKKLLTTLRKKDVNAAYFIALDHVTAGDKILSFAEPIVANVSFRGNVYSCQNEELGIVAVSPKLEECIKDFEDEIIFIWNEYGKEDDAQLTSDAKELKRRILRFIKQ